MSQQQSPAKRSRLDENPFASTHAELASFGGKILFATDDFFQVAEHLIMKDDPIWDEKKFTEFGKWMDGWETRRKRTEGHDWCILKLGMSGIIHGIDADTAFFTGNQTPQISIQAACLDHDLPLNRRSQMGTAATKEELDNAIKVKSETWEEILPMVSLRPGGIPTGFSNAHYGTPFRMIQPGESEGMYDGWETARNPHRPAIFKKGPDGHLIMPGNEWVEFKLAVKGKIQGVVIDTSHFKGNFPESAVVQAASTNTEKVEDKNSWFPLIDRVKLGPNAKHELIVPADRNTHHVSHVRLTIYPDGGVARFRVLGVQA
ncbi:hypothetical protein HDU76_001847 [Blyttiomyces sp. JEL0837]|nr:hypothetical protein HDU76_001847 [Blyttiomyces sp. JEL0837]